MSKYVYPAIITPEEKGGYTLRFPDIPNCFTDGDTLPELLENAADVLSLMLSSMLDKGNIPDPTNTCDLHVLSLELVTFVVGDTDVYSKERDCRAVKKTLTIPKWLNDLAEVQNIPFSWILQEALKEKLGVQTYEEYLNRKLNRA